MLLPKIIFSLTYFPAGVPREAARAEFRLQHLDPRFDSATFQASNGWIITSVVDLELVAARKTLYLWGRSGFANPSHSFVTTCRFPASQTDEFNRSECQGLLNALQEWAMRAPEFNTTLPTPVISSIVAESLAELPSEEDAEESAPIYLDVFMPEITAIA